MTTKSKNLDTEGTDVRWRTKGSWFNDKKREACPDICPVCGGTGKVDNVVCTVCKGTGETP
jgi:DnaJ-class molecular chaperone